ncbi:MAG: hypothetical protein FWF77_05755 [Defluviitaleaceae bacterium]|nr:hypothetical protein [Defluviitaleaceae bacterium]
MKKFLSVVPCVLFFAILACVPVLASEAPGEILFYGPGNCSRLRGNVSPPTHVPGSHRAHGALFYHYHNVLKVSEQPLFNAGGDINPDVLENLLEILSDPALDPMKREPKTQWVSGSDFTGAPFTAVTAADFSDIVVPEPANNNHTGAIIIKLFETIEDSEGVENGHLTELTDTWWQLVYRSTDDDNDVLTLWMVNPYRLTHFAGNRNDYNDGRSDKRFSDWTTINGEHSNRWRRIPVGENTILSDYEIANDSAPRDDFFFDGNYGAGIARQNLLRDLSFLLENFDVEEFLVAPRDLPGEWQSSFFQTGTNEAGQFYASGEFKPNSGEIYHGSQDISYGLGASGRWGSIDSFNINNGKDGLGIGPVYDEFLNTPIVSTYDDLLWLPSEFEIRIMGHYKDTPNVQTFVRYIGDPYSDMVFNTAGTDPIPQGGRTGLWRLNGFDRGFNPFLLGDELSFETYTSWIRSAVSNGLGNANVVSAPGNRYGNHVSAQSGLRPAVHLSITRLLEN